MIHPKIALSLVSLLPAFALHAQQVSATAAPPVPATAAESPVAAADAVLASWLAAECNELVVLARIAVRRSESAEVEKFAKTVIDEHASLESELRPFTQTAEAGSVSSVSADDSGKPDEAGRKIVEASSPNKAKRDASFDYVELIRALSQRCTAEQVKLLEATTSAEFDRSFMQAQVRAHARAAIMVDVFQTRASDKLRPALEKPGKMLRSHLDRAKALSKKCDAAAANVQGHGKQK